MDLRHDERNSISLRRSLRCPQWCTVLGMSFMGWYGKIGGISSAKRVSILGNSWLLSLFDRSLSRRLIWREWPVGDLQRVRFEVIYSPPRFFEKLHQNRSIHLIGTGLEEHNLDGARSNDRKELISSEDFALADSF
jgi:hypothetical protein